LWCFKNILGAIVCPQTRTGEFQKGGTSTRVRMKQERRRDYGVIFFPKKRSGRIRHIINRGEGGILGEVNRVLQEGATLIQQKLKGKIGIKETRDNRKG